MKIKLKNIGKITTADIDINGITVIAGKNNTGKSTVSKALYAVFNSLSNINDKIKASKINRIEHLLDKIVFNDDSPEDVYLDTNEVATQLVKNINEYKNKNVIDIKKSIINFFKKNNEDISFIDETYDDIFPQISDALNVTEDGFLTANTKKVLESEFNGQICNIFNDEAGQISLQIKDYKINIYINNSGKVYIKNPDKIFLHTEVVYLDDPYVLDAERRIPYSIFSSNSFNSLDHRNHLRRKLFSQELGHNILNEIIMNDKIRDIFKDISSVSNSEVIVRGRTTIGYRRKGSDKILNIRNLSTGIKTFVIIKMLLMKGVIEPNGTIILDEPEIHLHPEWQLLFAELIVLLQKSLHIHVLLNTHSPYFLNALEIYAVKHNISDKCKYYLATLKNDTAIINDVTYSTEHIYRELAKPLQDLENERGKL